MMSFKMENKKSFLCFSFLLFLSIVFGCVVQSHEMNSIEKQHDHTSNKTTEILHDPIEDNPEFKNIFATIDSEVHETLKHQPMRGGMGFCHIFWGTKKKILFEKYGIWWKSPAEMNPHMLFD
jgi:hypothetical protein